jgi:hypothetical protein
MMDAIRTINGLPLPPALVAALANGRWRTPQNDGRWYTLFPPSEVVRPRLYDERRMRNENADWAKETDAMYLGASDGPYRPGAIDPHRSLLIAELQYDAPLALDYRASPSNPSVVYMIPYVDGFRWTVVALDIESFMRALSLGVE